MVRDEARFLARCLESLTGVVDEIVVIDTGSVDDTPRIAAAHPLVRLLHEPWADDFSAMRNRTIAEARGRWVLIVDGDEYLTGEFAKPGALKRTLLEFEASAGSGAWPALAVKLPLVDMTADETQSFATHRQLRVFPRHPTIRYEMPIHNRLIFDLKPSGEVFSLELSRDDLTFIHRGYDPGVVRDKRKSERAFRILTQALETKPDALNYFYLGREHVHCDQWDEAIDALRRARELFELSNSALDKGHLQSTYTYLISAHHRRGDKLTEFSDVMQLALERFSRAPDLWHEAGIVFMDHGEVDAAISALENTAALLPEAQEADVSFVVHRPWSVFMNLATCYGARGLQDDQQKQRAAFAQAITHGVPDAHQVQFVLDAEAHDEVVWAGMATIPSRLPHLEGAVGSLLSQVDKLIIYLNNFEGVELPAFLRDDKIELVHSADALGDLRDSGKFYRVDRAHDCDVFMTVDDDILYPGNYVTWMLRKLRELEGQSSTAVAIGVHGARLLQPFNSYTRDRDVVHCLADNDVDQDVDILGTGTVMFRPAELQLSIENFVTHGMADIWFSAALKTQDVRRVVVARPAQWFTVLDVETGTLWEEAVRDDDMQTQVARRSFLLD